MDVSIIIVSWNTRDILHDCVSSIFECTKGIDFEVIVIDNSSTDGSVDMIREKFPEVILIENSQNRGFAAANNQGIAMAKGVYVLLLNSDTVILDNAIAKTFSFAKFHPEAAVAGCRILNVDRTLQPSSFMFPSLLNMLLSSTYLYKAFPKSRFFGREYMTWWKYNNVREVDVVTGCFMLVRRKALEQVGKMDEQFFLYGEETDWCYRFKKAGWKIVFAPIGKIIHIHGASSKQRKYELILQLYGSQLLFFKKYRAFPVYALASLLVVMFFMLRIPYWLVMAIISRNDRKSHLQRVRTYLLGCVKALLGARHLCVKRKFGHYDF